jgi:hypothetical protein
MGSTVDDRKTPSKLVLGMPRGVGHATVRAEGDGDKNVS